MSEQNVIRPGQVTMRIEATPGATPTWVLSAGPDAEEFAQAGVSAYRDSIGTETLHAVDRVEGKRETFGGIVPGFEIDLRDATGPAEVERRLSECLPPKGDVAEGAARRNEYAAWGDRKLEDEMHRTRVSMNTEWAHHREHSAKGLRAMGDESRTRASERQAVLDAEAAPAPRP